ncbi:MAG: winged helix-turn-helix domain-containing protein [Candidatus Nitrosopolaris sp.]
MYDVYLSHGLTKEYVRLLIEKDLIEYLDGERTFKTTDKGMNFLCIHNKVQQLTLVTTRRDLI